MATVQPSDMQFMEGGAQDVLNSRIPHYGSTLLSVLGETVYWKQKLTKGKHNTGDLCAEILVRTRGK